MTIIDVKLRKVGTSFGFILPMDVVLDIGAKEGDDIKISILRKNLKLLHESFGKARDVKFKFERDRIDRLERYNAS